MKRKKPEGMQWEEFVEDWHRYTHSGKVELSKMYGVTYETAKHWVSESGEARPVSSEPIPVVESRYLPPPERVNEPFIVTTTKTITKAVILGDFHDPYADVRTNKLVENFVWEQQPDRVVFNGDLNDYYQVSDFDKDPKRLGQLQDDLDITTNRFERYRERLPDAEFDFTEGTHENRWFKWLRKHAPALAGLRANSIEEMYKLDKYGVTYIPFERGMLVNDTFLILHGDIVTKHSGATARAQFEKQGHNGICNHTHRGGSFYKNDRFGIYGWYENFCMCRLDPDWLPNPNWVQGFSVVHFAPTGRYYVEQVPIIDHEFIYGGKIYK